MIDPAEAAIYLLIFPGFAFLLLYALFCEWVDRIVYARLQNRAGPPVFQPLADLLKLLSKEDIIPKYADRALFQYTPLIAFAAVMVPIMNIPIWGTKALYPLQGDLILTLYLLSIPTLALFVIGWSSTSLYSTVGAFRAATMLFGYEVPLVLTCLSAGILSGSWCISDITSYLASHPSGMLVLAPGFIIALIALEAKLERPPFDISLAETEIVGGTLTEYSGKKLAVMHLVADLAMVIGVSLVAAVFLGGLMVGSGTFIIAGTDLTPFLNFSLYIAKTLGIVFLLAVIRTLFARLRIDQMLDFSWKYLAVGGIFQLFLVILYAGMYQG
ncbi:MAG: complex I subunit 1 family protein [Methanoregula sp.]|jgi:NADH-quinone oxidoreductase subunit H